MANQMQLLEAPFYNLDQILDQTHTFSSLTPPKSRIGHPYVKIGQCNHPPTYIRRPVSPVEGAWESRS